MSEILTAVHNTGLVLKHHLELADKNIKIKGV